MHAYKSEEIIFGLPDISFVCFDRVLTCDAFNFSGKLLQISFLRLALSLPACRRLLFPLLHAEKGRLRNAVANRVPASRW